MARTLGNSTTKESAQKFRHLIASDGYITQQIVQLSIEKRMSLLHAASYLYGRHREFLSEDEESWKDVLRGLIRMCDNLHDLETWPVSLGGTLDVDKWDEDASGSDVGDKSWTATPFLALIKGAVLASYSPGGDTTFRTLALHAMKAWLHILSDCGVDLENYGYQEKKAFVLEAANAKEHVTCDCRGKLIKDQVGRVQWIDECSFWNHGTVSYVCVQLKEPDPLEDVPPMRLANFRYGTRLEDWELQFESSDEGWVGSFLDMAEQQANLGQTWSEPSSMPGGWVEEG
ncbi:MAG: hypothetical protein M1822_007477 [Bathelium mastoideum]|nr:MAG: hypothetical protein M1822_007477 [Bathelium mastoideum]